jgi:hypothetical protein
MEAVNLTSGSGIAIGLQLNALSGSGQDNANSPFFEIELLAAIQ